jgi:hypothetical protein
VTCIGGGGGGGSGRPQAVIKARFFWGWFKRFIGRLFRRRVARKSLHDSVSVVNAPQDVSQAKGRLDDVFGSAERAFARSEQVFNRLSESMREGVRRFEDEDDED